MPAKMRWPQVASPTGFRPGFSRLNSGICGPPHSPSSPGTAPLSSGVTCTASCSSFPASKLLWASSEPSTTSNDSLVLPLHTWLAAQGVRLVADCKVTDLDHKTEEGKFIVTGLRRRQRMPVKTEDGKFIVTGIRCLRRDKSEVIAVNDGDFVFLQRSEEHTSELQSLRHLV